MNMNMHNAPVPSRNTINMAVETNHLCQFLFRVYVRCACTAPVPPLR